mmetsp:Transcript_34233/g.33827  ORF Transcript_34233/g.33827 Transcript_34233/m.33827 type:complete len:238 (-) Transcript_34233:46-759(-)
MTGLWLLSPIFSFIFILLNFRAGVHFLIRVFMCIFLDYSNFIHTCDFLVMIFLTWRDFFQFFQTTTVVGILIIRDIFGFFIIIITLLDLLYGILELFLLLIFQFKELSRLPIFKFEIFKLFISFLMRSLSEFSFLGINTAHFKEDFMSWNFLLILLPSLFHCLTLFIDLGYISLCWPCLFHLFFLDPLSDELVPILSEPREFLVKSLLFLLISEDISSRFIEKTKIWPLKFKSLFIF